MEELSSITVSQREQFLVENDVFGIYNYFDAGDIATQKFMVEIQRDKQLDYLMRGLRQLAPSFSSLDANRPWLCYWILHSIALLGESVDDELENNVIDFLGRCQGSEGGYGGGPGQLPHLATSYAAVNTLVTVGGDKALSSINRMHDMGEMDVRACYTAISIASILNILDDELTRGLGDYIVSCQTYEGGIGGEPGSEAHGGYTYCGLATMNLINEVDRLDLDTLMNWAVHRQGVEMGFQGRTNKLVDGCYTFWQAAPCVLLQRLYSTHDLEGVVTESIIHPPTLIGECNRFLIASVCRDMYSCALRLVFCTSILGVLICFGDNHQIPDGGFRDKPRKARDFYHTCYCLSGLSVAQHAWSKDEGTPPLTRDILGSYSNLLEPVHLLHNIVMDRYNEANEFFYRAA
ncbi:unnamed protein product [Arabis nemorensis]|uniref:Protein farnesyltransferase subunit beta n=1 Tax=Arabis nemorensis TaxID=586526 RepID=A0A565C6T3_9BRAS|nr:unnamed protein product [Arabis nemorensis]